MVGRVWVVGLGLCLIWAAAPSLAQDLKPRTAAHAAPDAAGADEHPAMATGGEGARMDSACDHDAGSGDAGRAGDPRADRAQCRKLSDAEIAGLLAD